MQDFITITCESCGGSFKVDREAHNSFGIEAAGESLAFSYAGKHDQHDYTLVVKPRSDLCSKCCSTIAFMAARSWAAREGAYVAPLPQEVPPQPQEDYCLDDPDFAEVIPLDMLHYFRSDSRETRNQHVAIIVVLSLFLFILSCIIAFKS